MEASGVPVKWGYYDILAGDSLSLDSEPIAVESTQVYEAKAWVVGFEGSPSCALLAFIFLNEEGKELHRKIALIDDFSGLAKQYKIRAGSPSEAKQALVAYRVNAELPKECAPARVKLWFHAPDLALVPDVSAKGPAVSERASKTTDDARLFFRVRPGLSNEDILQKIHQVKHWYHRVEVLPGIFTPGTNDSYSVLARLGLPESCVGFRVLDVGARDGFFSFVMEQRGAQEVIAIDHVPAENTGFPVLREIFGSQVEFITDNVYNLSAEKYGKFDIVLCLGLLYHLRNPLLALEKIREVCSAELYVESFVIDNTLQNADSDGTKKELLHLPIMHFYQHDELAGDPTNWWGPTSTCLRQMIESTNFKVLSQETEGNRSTLRCVANEDVHALYYRTIEKGAVPGK